MPKQVSRVVLSIGTDNPPAAPAADTFEVVGNIINLSGPDGSKSEIDHSDQDSVGFREFFGGLADPGSYTLSGNRNFGNAGQETLRDDLALAGRQRNIRVEYRDSTGATVETQDVVGELFEFSQDASFDSAAQWAARIRLSGAVGYT